MSIEYTIIMEGELYKLETKIKEYILKGWRPQGGITVSRSGEFYLQAMIREAKDA